MAYMLLVNIYPGVGVGVGVALGVLFVFLEPGVIGVMKFGVTLVKDDDCSSVTRMSSSLAIKN